MILSLPDWNYTPLDSVARRDHNTRTYLIHQTHITGVNPTFLINRLLGVFLI